MLLYNDIVKKALDQEALPILREVVETSLTDRFGEEWYLYFARAIMEGYSEFKSVDLFIGSGKGKAIEAFDINAICYLTMPYDKDLKMYLDGAMPMIEEKFGLESNPERLKRMRTIQNNVSRGKIDSDMPDDEMAAVFGMQEKKWLLDIEKILREFRPEFRAEAYLRELDSAVGATVAKRKQQDEAASKRPDVNEVREAYTKIYAFDFSEAPVAAPLVTAAPWTADNADLVNLPWPSAVGQKAAKEAVMAPVIEEAEEAENMPVNIGQAPEQKEETLSFDLNDFVKPDPAGEPAKKIPGTAPNEETAEAVRKIPGTAPNESENQDTEEQNDAAEQKEKGKSKLFSWFKGKK